MNTSDSSSLGPPLGAPLADEEELYRVISPEWWVLAEDRVSSAAFSFPLFSVDVASLAGSPQATLARFRAGSGLVVFSCGEARSLGCVVRLEPDPTDPGNRAHAHVYMPPGGGKRRTAARKLVEQCRVIVKPTRDGT